MLALGIADERQLLRLSCRALEQWRAFGRVRLDKKLRLAEDGQTLVSWWD